MKYIRPNLLTRQEVANLAGLSYDVIYRNEQRLGLDQCRVEINQRLVFYYEDQAKEALHRAGLLVEID